MDAMPEWNSKYPICEAGQQFIFACRRTAARLDLSEAEMRASYARSNVPTPRGESRSVTNAVDAAAYREVRNAQSA